MLKERCPVYWRRSEGLHRLPVLYPNNSAPAPYIRDFSTLATLNAPGQEAVLASYARLGIIWK